jgi:hypothetical protein
MRDVYIVWKDYGSGDYSMVSVHETELGASDKLKMMFYEAKSNNLNPFWTDDRTLEVDHRSFNSDGYEVNVQKVPVLP